MMKSKSRDADFRSLGDFGSLRSVISGGLTKEHMFYIINSDYETMGEVAFFVWYSARRGEALF